LREGVLRKVDRLATVRFGSARYSAPKELVGERVAVAVVDPGQAAAVLEAAPATGSRLRVLVDD
jgi:hypothetical protein